MKFQLIDLEKKMCNQWRKQFKDSKDVEIYCDDIFKIKTDCIVKTS